eukprot:1333698-Pyramimonas_sp.AAC.1
MSESSPRRWGGYSHAIGWVQQRCSVHCLLANLLVFAGEGTSEARPMFATRRARVSVSGRLVCPSEYIVRENLL